MLFEMEDLAARNSSSSALFPYGERKSEIPYVEMFMKALDQKSLPQVQSMLQKNPLLANCHGSAFHVAPLHKTVEQEWIEGTEEILEKGGSVSAKNQFGQTPLHYAAAAGNATIMKLLLSKNCADLNVTDLRITTPLHDAASLGHTDVLCLLLEKGASPLVEDMRGETPLHKAAKNRHLKCTLELMRYGGNLYKKDDKETSPLRYLFQSSSTTLYRLLDGTLHSKSPNNLGFPITFDYEPLINAYGRRQTKLLRELVKSGNSEYLNHPICHTFLLIKWKKVKLFFGAYLLFFFVYALLTYVFLLNKLVWSKCSLESEAKYIKSKGKFFHLYLSENKVNRSCEYIDVSPEVEVAIQGGIFVQMGILTFMQMNLLWHQPGSFLYSLSSWLHLPVVSGTLSLIFCMNSDNADTDWQPHVATCIVFLLCLQLLMLLNRCPSIGIYVSMFYRVAMIFMKTFLIYLCLIMTFTLTFYLAFNARDQTHIVFKSLGLTFLKTLIMMIGEIDLEEDMIDRMQYLKYTSHLIVFLFILFISIILSNLLVALAVSDIHELRSTAHQMRLASIANTIGVIEILLDSNWPILKNLSSFCYFNPQTTKVILLSPRHPTKANLIVRETAQYLNQKDSSRELMIPSGHLNDFFVTIKAKVSYSQYLIRLPQDLVQNILDRVTQKSISFETNSSNFGHVRRRGRANKNNQRSSKTLSKRFKKMNTFTRLLQ